MNQDPDQPDRYDCIVIGAGPAGSTVATILARAGHSVVLIERDKMPREHVGESLMPATNSVLSRLGLEQAFAGSGFPRKVGVQFFSSVGKESRPFFFRAHDDRAESETWHVKREVFDQLLLDTARASGAEIWEETRVHRVLFDDQQRAEGVTILESDGQQRTVHSQVVVDATGQQSLIANQLGLKQLDSTRKNAAIWGYFQSPTAALDMKTVTIIAKTRDHDGWIWYIPLDEQQVSIGLVADRDRLFGNEQTPEQSFEWGLENCPAIRGRIEKHGLVPKEKMLIARDYSYHASSSCGQGWVLVGDAKGFIDPVYSTGVYLALRSGELAADAIIEGLKADDLGPAQLGCWVEDYDRRVAWLSKLVDLFYDDKFHFGSFFSDHPDQVGILSNLLMGRIYEMESGPNEFFAMTESWKAG